MATKSATLRLDLRHVDDVGAEAAQKLVESLVLSGYKAHRVERIELAADADDRALSIGDALAVVVFSHDYSFRLRMADAETLTGPIRAFVVFGHSTAAAALTADVLLTGNGSNVADVEAWVIDKPTT